MGSQQLREFGQGRAFRLGQAGQREQRVQLGVQVFKILAWQGAEAFAQLGARDDSIDRVEERSRQDRQSNLSEQTELSGNTVITSGQGLDLKAIAVTL